MFEWLLCDFAKSGHGVLLKREVNRLFRHFLPMTFTFRKEAGYDVVQTDFLAVKLELYLSMTNDYGGVSEYSRIYIVNLEGLKFYLTARQSSAMFRLRAGVKSFIHDGHKIVSPVEIVWRRIEIHRGLFEIALDLYQKLFSFFFTSCHSSLHLAYSGEDRYQRNQVSSFHFILLIPHYA